MSSFSRPSSSRDAISDFRLQKAEGFSGHRESNGATWGSDATNGCCRNDLHGTSGGVRGRRRVVHAPAAVLMFFYTLGTALIGHRYWTMTGTDRVDGMDSFFKNLSIMGGFLPLYITGTGKYSIDLIG
jgi:hypothetical protein